MTSTIHGHVDPCHKSSWLVRLQKKNGSWVNIDSKLTNSSSNVTFTYSGGYPATLRIFCAGGSCGGDDYDDDTAPVSAGLTFYQEQEVWFTLNLPKIPTDDPPSVSTQAATSIAWDNGTFHATLNGTVTQTGGATVLERGFNWGLSSGNLPNSWTENGSWGTGSFSHVISGLDVKIYFKAKARNVEGWGYGSELSFDPPPHPPTLSCFTPLDIDWDNGTFHGTLDATITNTGGATVLERGFDWGYSSGNYPYDWTEGGSFGIGNYDHYVSGFTGKVYFRAKARNSAGWGYSSEKSFNPPAGGIDPPTVTTQAATGVEWDNGSFRGTLHGTIVDTGGEDCDQRGFNVGYSPGVYSWNFIDPGTFGAGSFQKLLINFTQKVYYRAAAHNSEGWGYGNEVSFSPPTFVVGLAMYDDSTSEYVVGTLYIDGTPYSGLDYKIIFGMEHGNHTFEVAPPAGYSFVEWQIHEYGGPLLDTSTTRPLVWYVNQNTWIWAEVEEITPPPDPPTNVVATDGTYTNRVRITWTKSAGATGYQVYRDGTPTGWLGDVAVYDDYAAHSPYITPGTTQASDGTYTGYVRLTLTGEGTNPGTIHVYKVKARNAEGESGYSNTNNGNRGVGSLSHQWYKSAGDSNASYSSIGGGTTEPYNYTGAPAPTVTPGTAAASDGSYTGYVRLTLSGESTSVGAGRYYKCLLSAAGCSSVYSSANRGYRGVGSLTRQWYKSAGDSNASYSSISGGTTDPYNYTGAPAPTVTPGTAAASDGISYDHVSLSLSDQSANVGAGRYYKCLVSASGASSQYSTANRGYRGVGSLAYQWYRSAGDSDASYSSLSGATGASYDDEAAPAPTITHGTCTASDGSYSTYVRLINSGASANVGAGRYYKCLLSATGASSQYSSSNRGYRGVGNLTYQWYKSAGDSDADYSAISGGTTATYNYTGAPAPSITKGIVTATDGTYTDRVYLNASGYSTNGGAGRYYKCYHTATGAVSGYTGSNRGHTWPGTLNRQWQKSAVDSDGSYSDISGATSDPYNYYGAPAPSITKGTVTATDGTYTSQVKLDASGYSTSNGAGRWYRAKYTASGCTTQYTSGNRGYRSAGTLSRQWQKSAGDSPASYSDISGATSDPYNYTGAPPPTITPGAAAASDGTSQAHVSLSLSGESTNVGAGRYYRAKYTASGCTTQYTSSNRGYRGVGPLVYQWQRSAGDSDSDYSDIDGATTASYDDTGAPSNGDGRYYQCVESATGASSQTSTSDRGYRLFIAIPDPPTNVLATDGTYPDKVRITWTKSAGATGYQVYRDESPLGWLGDVATHDDYGADAPYITGGTTQASDGTYTGYVRLTLTGEGLSPGSPHTYKVKAKNAGGESGYSGTNNGNRGGGTLQHQWYKSAGDSDATYSQISGGTTEPYNYTGAPAPTITPGAAAATDGIYIDYVRLTLSGESTSVGAGRYYKCLLSATGYSSVYSSSNRGYRGVGSLTYQWRRSAADSDANYGDITGATSEPYNDTGAPGNGDGRWYYCELNATGAGQQDSTHNRGYRLYQEAVTMIGGPTGFVWGTPLAQLSVVKKTTDGGLTWIWTTVVGAVMIPNGGPEGWIWDEVTIYVEG